MRPRVAVLHHPRSFFALDLFREVGECAELVWVVDEACAGDPTMRRILPRLGTVVDISGLDVDTAAKCLSQARLDGIVSFVDDNVVTAALLADRLGLPYHSPEVARVLVDKRSQRAALDSEGVPGPGFWLLAAGSRTADVAALAERISYPVVLKPAEGSGSRGILLIGTAAELVSAVDEGDPATGYIVEEYLDDDPDRSHGFASYFSIESVITAGHTDHVAVTGRFALAAPFRETGNFIPGVLEPAMRAPVLAIVDDAIRALGITSAVMHTEIKQTPDGPKLVEVNGRLGGRPPFVLGSVSDINLFQVACEVAVGDAVTVENLATCREVGFWRMIQPPQTARRVKAIDGVKDISQLPGVDSVSLDRHPGDTVDWHAGTASQVVTVRGRVADHKTLAQVINSIDQLLRIDYESADDRGPSVVRRVFVAQSRPS
ncbi:MAG TPA: ATP-grasp domain-containing protein [Acidothermaceae bacterium]